MNPQSTIPIIITIFLLLSLSSFSQTKYEREYGLDEEKVPKIALEFMDVENLNTDINWYCEENLKGNSIEAKLEYQERKYSIEFDTLGNLQDIEVEWKFDELSEYVKTSIETHLKDTYEKFGIEKIQIQYSGKIAGFAEFLMSENPASKYHINYELIVKGKKDEDWHLYEIILDASCKLKQTSEIILRNTDNLVH